MKSKGVTPVVAVVLLMAIAVAATTTAYQFLTNAQDDVQQSFEERWSQDELERKSDFNIEAIYEGGDGDAFMTIRNTGSVRQILQNDEGQKYWTLYVDKQPAGSAGTDWTYVGGGGSGLVGLSPGSTINLDTNVGFPADGGGKEFELIGRYESSDTYFCENTGSSSC